MNAGKLHYLRSLQEAHLHVIPQESKEYDPAANLRSAFLGKSRKSSERLSKDFSDVQFYGDLGTPDVPASTRTSLFSQPLSGRKTPKFNATPSIVSRHGKWKALWAQRKAKETETACMTFEDRYSRVLGRKMRLRLRKELWASARSYHMRVMLQKVFHTFLDNQVKADAARNSRVDSFRRRMLSTMGLSLLMRNRLMYSASSNHLAILVRSHHLHRCIRAWREYLHYVVSRRHQKALHKWFRVWVEWEMLLIYRFRVGKLFSWWKDELRRLNEIEMVKLRLWRVVLIEKKAAGKSIS